MLTLPLRWRKPRLIFVNSMGDIYHEHVPVAWIDRVYAVMALAPHHTFQILTKRPNRMCEYITNEGTYRRILRAAHDLRVARPRLAQIPISNPAHSAWWPHVWHGTSVESQDYVDRLSWLARTPAAVRFASFEPLLGPIRTDAIRSLDWAIVGGESGSRARPMHPDWARSIRDQCAAFGVPFFFKQHGEWMETEDALARGIPVRDEIRMRDGTYLGLVGKKRAGRRLDGTEHNGFPQTQHQETRP